MEIQPDLRDLLGLFNEPNVEYMIMGGYALAFHGAPRYTGEVDIFVRPEPGNARKILSALDAFHTTPHPIDSWVQKSAKGEARWP